MTTLTQSAAPTVADAIESTLEWLDRQGCVEQNSDRRAIRRSRYRVAAKILYTPPGTGNAQWFDVTTRNLSRTGMSFLHKALIYPRQGVEVSLPLPDKSVRHLRARVVRVRPAGVGAYEIGVEFTEVEVAVA